MSSRRGFLKKTIGGAVLLGAVAAVPVALRKTRLGAVPNGLKFFNPTEYSIWSAVAARILATDPTEVTAGEAKLTGSVPRPAAPGLDRIDVALKADGFLAPL